MSPLLQSPLTIEYALLGFVRREPLHGYEIYHRLVETPELHLVWRVKQSRLYALLARLEEEGQLGATHEPQDGRPPRKVYHLTPTGEAAFGRWLVAPVRLPREMRLEFMLKLYFAGEEGAETVGKLIHAQQAVCEKWPGMWMDDEETAGPFGRAVKLYRRKHIEAIRDWLASLAAEHVTPAHDSVSGFETD
ncbi:MAG: PadR family transcriptional regulator [Candidatus Promineofilum sp.]|nr:PadR family transcriptional regulator [Promineifilum sp.]